MDSGKLKLIFLAVIIIAAFILTPSLGKDLFGSCKQLAGDIKNTTGNISEGLKENPIKLK